MAAWAGYVVASRSPNASDDPGPALTIEEIQKFEQWLTVEWLMRACRSLLRPEGVVLTQRKWLGGRRSVLSQSSIYHDDR